MECFDRDNLGKSSGLKSLQTLSLNLCLAGVKASFSCPKNLVSVLELYHLSGTGSNLSRTMGGGLFDKYLSDDECVTVAYMLSKYSSGLVKLLVSLSKYVILRIA